MKQSSSFINGILLAALVLIWGLTWPMSKLALGYSSPILLSGLRSLSAGIILLAVALPRYKQLHWKQNWRKYMVSGLFNSILFYGLQTIGLMFMPAGVFSVIVYLQPVLIGIIAWMWIGESMNAVKIGGLLLGFVGVATISTGELSANASAVGILLAVLTALSWAIGTVYIKRISDSVDGHLAYYRSKSCRRSGYDSSRKRSGRMVSYGVEFIIYAAAFIFSTVFRCRCVAHLFLFNQ